MKNTFKNIGLAAWYIYFLSMMFASPYFNWRYAKERGFVSWLASSVWNVTTLYVQLCYAESGKGDPAIRSTALGLL